VNAKNFFAELKRRNVYRAAVAVVPEIRSHRSKIVTKSSLESQAVLHWLLRFITEQVKSFDSIPS